MTAAPHRPTAANDLRNQVRNAVHTSGRAQITLAADLGISEKHLSQMLTGRARLTIEWAEKILRACDGDLHITVLPSTLQAPAERLRLDDLTSDQLDALCDRLRRAELAVTLLTDAHARAERAEQQAAEVRAAAFDQAADAVQSDGVRLNTAATEAAARRGPVALIAHVQAAVADRLRRLAAAARPDFQDRGEAARQAAGIDGTAGDAQDVPHDFVADTETGGCLLCGLAPGYRKHTTRPDNTEAHQPHVCYVLERAISDGWVEERVVDEPAAAAQAVEDYDAWWLLPATLRVVRRTSLSTVVSVHEVAKPGPCTCGHPHEQHLPICGRSRQCRSLCDCDAYRPDNTTGA